MYFFRNPGGKAWISCSQISKANILNVKFWNCECTCVNITKKFQPKDASKSRLSINSLITPTC